MPRISAHSVAEHRRQTAERILDVVEEILEANQGVGDATQNLTVGLVAKKLGMGRSSLYRYHENVDSMIEAVVVRDFPRRAKEITTQMQQAESPLEAIHAYALASFREAKESRHSWRASLSRLHLGDEARARIGRLHAELTQALAAHVEELPSIAAELKPELVSSIQGLINAGVSAVSAPQNYSPTPQPAPSIEDIGEQTKDGGYQVYVAPTDPKTVTVQQQEEASSLPRTRRVEPLNTEEIERWYLRAIDAVIAAAQDSIRRPKEY